MTEHVFVLSRADLDALGTVRTIPRLLVATTEREIWLRGIPDKGEFADRLRQLPALRRYTIDLAEQLFLHGDQVPSERLPQLAWLPIAQLLPVDIPTAALAGQVQGEVRIQLVPSSEETSPVALLCRLPDLQAWAASAAESRIGCLRMAANSDGQVLLLGNPLPPLPGTGYWACEGLLLPAGYVLEFPILAPMILARCNPGRDGFVWMQANGNWEHIPLQNFVTATRSGIRQTLQPTP